MFKYHLINIINWENITSAVNNGYISDIFIDGVKEGNYKIEIISYLDEKISDDFILGGVGMLNYFKELDNLVRIIDIQYTVIENISAKIYTLYQNKEGDTMIRFSCYNANSGKFDCDYYGFIQKDNFLFIGNRSGCGTLSGFINKTLFRYYNTDDEMSSLTAYQQDEILTEAEKLFTNLANNSYHDSDDL